MKEMYPIGTLFMNPTLRLGMVIGYREMMNSKEIGYRIKWFGIENEENRTWVYRPEFIESMVRQWEQVLEHDES